MGGVQVDVIVDHREAGKAGGFPPGAVALVCPRIVVAIATGHRLGVRRRWWSSVTVPSGGMRWPRPLSTQHETRRAGSGHDERPMLVLGNTKDA